jgi:hypothetical protein
MISIHRKKLASAVAANPASAKLAARVVANIMPPSAAELANVLVANSNDAVTLYVSVHGYLDKYPEWSLILPG